MRETTKYFLLGTVAGVLLLIAPWWISVTVILFAIIREVWGNHDGPAQA